MTDLLNSFGIVIIPEAVLLTAKTAYKNPERKVVEAAVIDQLPYPSQGFKIRLKQTAFTFFDFKENQFILTPLLEFLAQSSESQAMDIIIFESLKKFSILLFILELIREQPIQSQKVASRLSSSLKRPESAVGSALKGISTLKKFGLVSSSKGNFVPLSYSPTVLGLGYVLHSEYPKKLSITATLDSILENPFIRAYGCHAHEIMHLLEEGSTKKFWALERDNVFQRVVFPHTLETFVKLALEH